MDLPHDTKVKLLLVSYIVLFTLATITIALRFYTRARITNFVGADDWWILAAYIVGLSELGLWIAYLHFGNGHHIWDVSAANIGTFFLILYLIQMTYSISLGLIKMSSLALYLRIFPSESFKAIVRFTMLFIVLMTVAVTLSGVFQCLPIDSNWDLSKWGTRKCINRVDQQYAASALSFATDIVVLLLPIKYLIKLPISLRAKIQVIVLMCLGGVTCIASVVRFRYIHLMANSKDSTYDGWHLSFWTALEFFLGMITTSMPAIKPLWTTYIKKFRNEDGQKLSSTQQSKEENYITHPSNFRSVAMRSTDSGPSWA